MTMVSIKKDPSAPQNPGAEFDPTNTSVVQLSENTRPSDLPATNRPEDRYAEGGSSSLLAITGGLKYRQ
ncbi:MAG TPA: hypothetical protein VLJ37_02800 [bacterium]|nr:hypothetical protein [bacterium]